MFGGQAEAQNNNTRSVTTGGMSLLHVSFKKSLLTSRGTRGRLLSPPHDAEKGYFRGASDYWAQPFTLRHQTQHCLEVLLQNPSWLWKNVPSVRFIPQELWRKVLQSQNRTPWVIMSSLQIRRLRWLSLLPGSPLNTPGAAAGPQVDWIGQSVFVSWQHRAGTGMGLTYRGRGSDSPPRRRPEPSHSEGERLLHRPESWPVAVEI